MLDYRCVYLFILFYFILMLCVNCVCFIQQAGKGWMKNKLKYDYYVCVYGLM